MEKRGLRKKNLKKEIIAVRPLPDVESNFIKLDSTESTYFLSNNSRSRR